MKKRFFRFAILPLLAGILVGCAELNIGTALRNDPAAPGPMKIGVIAPLSGGNRFYGERMLDGVQLAVEELNNGRGINGRKVELLVRDSRSEPERAAELVRDLNDAGIVGLIAGYSSDEVLAIAPEARRHSLPTLVPLATSSEIFAGNPFLFRNTFTGREEAKALAGYAWYWRKLLRIAVLTDAGPRGGYSREIGREAVRSFTALGGTVVRAAEIQTDDPGLEAVLRDVLAAAPQGILIPFETSEAALLVRQLREMGYQGLLFGGDSWDENRFLRTCGAQPGDCAYIAFYSPESDSPENRLFRDSFRRTFYRYPGSCEAQGYDAVKLLAIGLSGTRTLEEFTTNLLAVRNQPMAAGLITILPEGKLDRTVYINTIRPAGRNNPEPTGRTSKTFLLSKLDQFVN